MNLEIFNLKIYIAYVLDISHENHNFINPYKNPIPDHFAYRHCGYLCFVGFKHNILCAQMFFFQKVFANKCVCPAIYSTTQSM